MFDAFDVGQAPQAWKTLGENLDGLSFPTVTSPGHCKPAPGAKPSDVIVDGVDGIDNAFSRNIVPLLLDLDSSMIANLQKGPATGRHSYFVALATTEAQFFAVQGEKIGANGFAPPLDWSTYVWHPFSSQVDDPSSPHPASLFHHVGAEAQGTWSSSERADAAPLMLSTTSTFLAIPLRRAKLVITPGPAGTAKGLITAIVPVVELQDSIKAVMASISSGLCSGSAIQGVLDQVAGSADMLLDGTQDPGQVCNAISLGIGFTARSSTFGMPALIQTSTCDN